MDRAANSNGTAGSNARSNASRGAAREPGRDLEMNFNQIRFLETLTTKRDNQTIEQIAHASGISRATAFRYLRDPAFKAAFVERMQMELSAERTAVMKELVRGAKRRGSSQPAMQRLYWQLMGELVERSEVDARVEITTNDDGGMARVPISVRKLLLELYDNPDSQLPIAVDNAIRQFLGMPLLHETLSLPPTYYRHVDHGAADSDRDRDRDADYL